ncbi:MAG: phage tail tube protein [Culicoidibacterales bacterium]
MGIKQRRQIANYLNIAGTETEKYVLCSAGFTELSEAPSAQTASKRYVGDKTATTTIVGYEWSTAFNTDYIADQEAVAFIANIGEKQLVGADAETTYVIVDLDKQAGTGKYAARQIKIAVEVANFDNNDGEMAITGNFLGCGDMIVGSFDTTTKTFTAGEVSPTVLKTVSEK